MERPVLIREAREDDLPALTAIYNHYVVHSVATFDVETFTPAQREEWFAQFDLQGPHRLFVSETDGAVNGYACSTRFRAKPAYAESIETGLYVDPQHTGRGLGRHLYTALFRTLAQQRVHRAYAVVALPNEASRVLHMKFGFRPLHTLHEVGRKLDRYVDTEWFEKRFD